MGREGRGANFGGFGSVQFPNKRITLIVCCVNLVIALYVFQSLYSSLYIFPSNYDNAVKRYSDDHNRKIEESIKIRKASEPIELINMVKKLKVKFWSEEAAAETKVPEAIKNQITYEILQTLRSLRSNASLSEQREALETWREEKLKEARKLVLGGEGPNSTVLLEEAENLAKVLELNWAALSQEIGFWIPTEVLNREHNDKPEGVEDIEDEGQILAGRPLPPECRTELHTDYDGDCVRWGLSHPQESAADCCQACLDQAKHAKPGDKKCNIWVYCPSESGCYSPDKYEHKHMECWLKYSEKPRLNFKDRYSEEYRSRHPKAPVLVPWVSGVVSA